MEAERSRGADPSGRDFVRKLANSSGFYSIKFNSNKSYSFSSGQVEAGVLSGSAPQPDGVGVLLLFDGGQYWGGWCKGERQGWGVWRSCSGDEYRGEFRRGKYCGFGVLREGAVSRFGRWVDGVLVVQQRLAAAALVAAREAAICAGSCAGMCFPDESRAAAEAILCCILAAAEKQCSLLDTLGKQVVARSSSNSASEACDGDLRLIRNTGDDPEFEFWGYSMTTSVLNEVTHKLERRVLPHLWGRQVSLAFGWVYRGQFNNGKLHGLGGVVWRRLELIQSELRYVCETYIGNWKEGRREGRGVFARSDGTSEQGMWRNNDLVEEFCIEMQELITFQAAVNQGEAAAKSAQARAHADASNSAAFRADTKPKTDTKPKQPDKPPAEEEQSSDQFDAYSDEYIAKLIHLLIENSQARDAAQLAINRDYEAECRREEDSRQREAAAFAAHQAAIAGDSDSGDDGPAFCSMSTAFFAGRRYFGDSPVNVGIEFDRNSRPSIVKEFSPNFNGQPHGFGCLWQQIGTKSDPEMSFYQGEFKHGLAHGWGEKRSSAGIYRGQWEKDKRHGFGQWVFPDGSVSVSFWHFDSVVKTAFIPPLLRQELENVIHKAQVSAVAAGCQEDFDVHPDEVLEWRRVRESRVMEAKRSCAVELALTTHKYLGGDVGFSTLPRGLPFYEKKSYEDLKRLDRDNTNLDVNNLENYLNEEEFEEAFGISSFAFRLLKPQDKKALKARAGLLPEKVAVKRVEDDKNSKGKQIYRATIVRRMGGTPAVKK